MNFLSSLPIALRCYLGITAVMSVITFLTFGLDKLKSKMGISIGSFRVSFGRIPEKTLLTLSFLGGSPGAVLGMLIFRHKTHHTSFRVWTAVHLVIWSAVGYAVIEYGPQAVEAVKAMIG